MTTLVTFIGRTEANRAYKVARYRFQDGSVSESSLFAAAALADLRRAGRLPKRLVAIGTPTSGWDVLLELVARLAPDAQDEALQWAVPVSESLQRGPVEASQLRDFEQRFSSRLGLDIKLCLASNDGDSVFGALAGSLEQGASVTLDITHSFRSMPVHALVALGAMRWLKSVEITDIIYGSLDEKSADGTSAARSLGTTAQLAQTTPALAQLALVDDVGGVAPYLSKAIQSPTVASALNDTQRLESIMQFDSAGAKRGQALGELRRLSPDTVGATAAHVAAKVKDTLESLDLGKGSFGLINRAKRALERGDFMRAVGLANEALSLKVVELHDLRTAALAEAAQTSTNTRGDHYQTLNTLVRAKLQDNANHPDAPALGRERPYYTWRALNDARNAVMHAGTGLADQKPPTSLLSPEELRKLLAWAFRFYDFVS
jgi:CRISPR-associated Csx2 family protein